MKENFNYILFWLQNGYILFKVLKKDDDVYKRQAYDMAVGVVKEKEILPIIIMVCAFIATYLFNVNVIYVILSCGFIGIIQNMVSRWRERQ